MSGHASVWCVASSVRLKQLRHFKACSSPTHARPGLCFGGCSQGWWLFVVCDSAGMGGCCLLVIVHCHTCRRLRCSTRLLFPRAHSCTLPLNALVPPDKIVTVERNTCSVHVQQTALENGSAQPLAVQTLVLKQQHHSSMRLLPEQKRHQQNPQSMHARMAKHTRNWLCVCERQAAPADSRRRPN